MDMKPYTCHKTVQAAPMNRADYLALRGWTLPAGENGADEGYLVEYPDGGKPNVQGYANYVSWSPKDVFELGYTEQATTFMQRLHTEKDELYARIVKLTTFMHEPAHNTLSEEVRKLLKEQYACMHALHDTLVARIAHLTKK